jgi:hypothetical protein
LTTTCFLAAVGAAQAECLVCDDLVEINSARASCFMENHERILAAVSAAPDGRMAVDFETCSVGGEKLDFRGGVATLPDLDLSSKEDQPPTKSVYLLDSASVVCLRDLIAKHQGSLDPVAKFDLFEKCRP